MAEQNIKERIVLRKGEIYYMPRSLISSTDKRIFLKSCPRCQVPYLIFYRWETDEVCLYDCIVGDNMELVSIFKGKRGDIHKCPYCETKFTVHWTKEPS